MTFFLILKHSWLSTKAAVDLKAISLIFFVRAPNHLEQDVILLVILIKSLTQYKVFLGWSKLAGTTRQNNCVL
jgi:hypothetical protein